MSDKMVKIKINGKEVEVKFGTTIVEAAKSANIVIPTLCYNSMFEAYGVCRVCLTEIKLKGKSKMVTACNYPIRQEMEIETQSAKVKKARKTTLSLMLSRWPNVPKLKELGEKYGAKPSYKHPNVNRAKNACILCGLCVQMCNQGIWEKIITFSGRGPSRKVVMPFEEHMEECLGCGACVSVCPTGAISVYDDKNNPADPLRIIRAGSRVTEEMVRYDDVQCKMRKVGTAHLTEIMDEYDLLPTHNYQYGSHKETHKIASNVFINKYITQNLPDGCWHGCSMSCAKTVDNFVLKTGPYKGQKVTVDGPEYETVAGCGSNIGVFDPEAIIEINFYCDTYGVDTISFGTMTAFIMECYERGILNKEKTGDLELYFGNKDAVLELLHQMARGEGFGKIAGQGTRKMKKYFSEHFGADYNFLQDIAMEVKGLEFSEYVSKESIAQQGGYALALKGPQHDEAWLIFMDMVNKQLPTFEDKAEALHYFPMFRTWFGLNGLCKLPWNDVEPPDNAKTSEPSKVPGHVKGYLEFFAGMTGKEITPKDLIKMSERVYNFQRVFNLRMGFGTRQHDRPPYRAMGPVTKEEYESRQERYDKQLREIVKVDPQGKSTQEKMAVVRKYREGEYEKLLDAVYKRRGWTRDGVPTPQKLKELGMDYPWVLDVVKKHL